MLKTGAEVMIEISTEVRADQYRGAEVRVDEHLIARIVVNMVT